MATALIFPGQGAPAAEWQQAAAAACPALYERAGELCAADPFERFGESTEFDQPAIYCASIAALELADTSDSCVSAGHSLGEIAALVAAGSLDPMQGLEVVVVRAREMARVAASGPAGGMLAVRAPAGEIGELAQRHGLVVANLNTSSQTVLSGPLEGIESAEADLGESQMLVKRLRVAGAFHSPQMAPARAGFRSYLEAVDFAAPLVPVLSCRTATPISDPADELARALVEPVDWIATVKELARRGADRFLELGPGKALSGMVRRIVPGADAQSSPLPEPVRA